MAEQSITLQDQANGKFNYTSEAEDIRRKKAIAQALYGQQLSGNVGWQAALAKALSSYMGGKQEYEASEAQKNLDTRSAQEYSKALNDYFAPAEAEKTALNDPAIYKYADPNAVGPTMDQLNGVTTKPVAQSEARGTPLPPLTPISTRAPAPAAAPVARPVAAPTPVAAGGTGQDEVPRAPTQDELFAKRDALAAARGEAAKALSFYRQGLNRASDPAGAKAAEQKVLALDSQIKSVEDQIAPPAGMQGRSLYGAPKVAAPVPAPASPVPPQALAAVLAAQQGQTGQVPAPQPQAQPAPEATPPAQPTAAPAPRPALAGAMNAQQLVAAQSAGMNARDLGPDFYADRAAASGVLGNVVRAEADRKRQALDTMYASGPRGQKTVDAIQAANLARMVKDKDDEYTTTSLGDGRFVTTNKRTGQQTVGNAAAGAPELKISDRISALKAHSDDSKELDMVNTSINTLNKGLEGLDGVRKNLGDVATGPWSSVFNSMSTVMPGEYGSKVKAVRAYFKSSAFQNAKADLVNQISDSDAKAYLQSTPDDSWNDAQIAEYLDRYETATRQQVTTQKETANRYGSNIAEYNKMLGRGDSTAAPAPAASQGGAINGVPRYQRGVTLRP